MLSKWKDKVVIITGGSSGIGLALARLFVNEGAKLYLIARDYEKLRLAADALKTHALGSTCINVIAVDVSDCEKITRTIQSIGEAEGEIDLLINNAGLMRCGKFSEIPIEDFELSIQSNFMGSLYASKAAWKYLAAAKGHIGFVGTVAGYIGLIGYAAYSPSKFAMTGLAECLRMEGKTNGIKVSIIYPGDVQTPLLEYEHSHALPEMRALNKEVEMKTPDEVAAIFKKKIEAGKFEIYCDGESRIYRVLKVLLPKLFYSTIDRTAKKARNIY